MSNTKARVIWSRKFGHLWQSFVSDTRHNVYGYGTTRKAATAHAKAAIAKAKNQTEPAQNS